MLLASRSTTDQKMESGIDTKELTKIICKAALERKAEQIVVLDVSEQSTCGAVIILCNGMATRQVRAVAENALQTMKREHNRLPLGVEGRGIDQWVIVDYGSVLLHVFQPEMREYYDLDGLWAEVPRISLEELGLTSLDEASELD
jgi:ribosome silencing factor RsfS/YbeB/iojap